MTDRRKALYKITLTIDNKTLTDSFNEKYEQYEGQIYEPIFYEYNQEDQNTFLTWHDHDTDDKKMDIQNSQA